MTSTPATAAPAAALVGAARLVVHADLSHGRIQGRREEEVQGDL